MRFRLGAPQDTFYNSTVAPGTSFHGLTWIIHENWDIEHYGHVEGWLLSIGQAFTPGDGGYGMGSSLGGG